MVLLEMSSRWMLSCYGGAKKINNVYGGQFALSRTSSSSSSSKGAPHHPSVSNCPCLGRQDQTIVCDLQGALIGSTSLFPYFMLVAFEGGGILRAFLLLLSYPLLLVLSHARQTLLALRFMTFIVFCGLRTSDMDTVARAVLPKFLLEDLNLQAYQVVSSTGRKVVLTCMPRVMVERFLKDYLSVDIVMGTELNVVGGGRFFSGFPSGSGVLVKHRALRELFGEAKPDIALGCGGSSNLHDQQLFMSLCKEAYVVISKDGASAAVERHPKPLVFHDGRLAFFPTPSATFILFLWLPLGMVLALTRAVLGICMPYSFRSLANACTGFTIRVKGLEKVNSQGRREGGGLLFVCTHRTLLDPVAISAVLRRPVTAVTYSLSRVSEIIAPIRTVRLTRDRARDGATMKRLLREGDLVVCPEGTTCREPYLLRFSPLFAELTNDIVPVAVDVKVSMFYGTTASGRKWLDPFFLLMNPNPAYTLEFLGKVPTELTCAGGLSSYDVANGIQRRLAEALGFKCTTLTRKDKYLMLAGNEGLATTRAHIAGHR